MAKSVVILASVAAKNIDSLNKSGVYAGGALENGHVVAIDTKSTTDGQKDVYTVTLPESNTLNSADFFIVYEAPVPVVGGKYKGITDDPREFEIPAGTVFNMFKPTKEDEIIISADGIGGTKENSTNGSHTHVAPAGGTGKLTWTSSIGNVSLALVYEGDTFISIGNERVAAYRFRVVKA